jgi:hypothetical protein
MMGPIYRFASSVLVWLGSEEELSSEGGEIGMACAYMKELADRAFPRYQELFHWKPGLIGVEEVLGLKGRPTQDS